MDAGANGLYRAQTSPSFFTPVCAESRYATAPVIEHRRERILPTGCAHLVVSLSHDFLTECREDSPPQRTAPALVAGQRSVYEIIATSDLVDLAGIHFIPGTASVFVSDRADLISNRSLPLDQIWPDLTDTLRSRMLEGSSPEARLHILETCLAAVLLRSRTGRDWSPHPAVRFALEQFALDVSESSISNVALRSGWSERRVLLFEPNAKNLTILGIPYCSLADFRRTRMYGACRSMTNHLAHTAREVCDWLGSSLPTHVSLIGQVLRKRICTSTVRWLSNKEFQIAMG